MRFHRNRSHVIDLIFPLAVLFVFAASSLVVLILSVHIYTGQTEQAEAHYRTDTPLSYVEEKIRQNDVAGKNIIEASDFKVAELNNGLYRITITDTEGVTNSRILSERSHS